LNGCGYTPTVDNDFLRFAGIVIAWVAILLFWLGVNVLDGWVQRNVYPPIRLWFASAREKLRRRQGGKSTRNLRRP
jgi:hypothetical protein